MISLPLLSWVGLKVGICIAAATLVSTRSLPNRLPMSSTVPPDLHLSELNTLNPEPELRLLTDPMLQNPQPHSIDVVWFTEFPGEAHRVYYGPDLSRSVTAQSFRLTQMQEDDRSWVGEQSGDGRLYSQPQSRAIWRHRAIVTGLEPGVRWPYAVESQAEGQVIRSDRFSLAAAPPPGQPLKILLTSDHQLKPMVAANLEKVAETVGAIDGIFMAGDLVNVPDRASEWFDDRRGGAFFPALQGSAHTTLGGQVYRGAPLLQSAPLFPALGNHEVMGRRLSPVQRNPNLNQQFEDAIPKTIALNLAQAAGEPIPPETDPHFQSWLQDRSFNWQTLRELWYWPPATPVDPLEQSNPLDPPEVPGYYAISFGDVRLVVLYATTIWRPWGLGDGVRGRYRERTEDLAHPERWGYGQHIFEPIHRNSAQYQWLETELASEAFQKAPYTVVMLHHPIHTLGENVVPAYTDPVPVFKRDAQAQLTAVYYEYPLDQDYLNRDLVPLLESAGVDLVLNGHSHLWNRFTSPAGLRFLETSNVGNSYGAFWQGANSQSAAAEAQTRPVPKTFQETYVPYGDPWGLDPVLPNIAPLTIAQTPLPYIASNDITVFSIFDTGDGSISSYYFDTRDPKSEVVLFDRFWLTVSETED